MLMRKDNLVRHERREAGGRRRGFEGTDVLVETIQAAAGVELESREPVRRPVEADRYGGKTNGAIFSLAAARSLCKSDCP
jgi:hypothetical protein